MPKQLKYFGTSGIRGRTLKDITPIFAHKMAFAFATFFDNHGTVVVGRDTRYGAHILEYSVISGLTAGGMDVIQCGIIPTPGLCERSVDLDAKAAVMITGSHIPPDRIGLIWQFGDGSYIDDKNALKIEAIFDSLDDKIDYPPLEKLGSIQRDHNAPQKYLNTIQTYIPKELIRNKQYKVVLDCANGTGAQLATDLLHKYGCQIIAINDVKDPRCSRISEPIEKNLEDLMSLVQNTNAALGIGFDIDFDRSAFVTIQNGESAYISANVIGTLLMEERIKENPGNVVLPINTSGLANEILAKYDLKPYYCKIGQPDTIRVCKEKNAVFSFEESGKFYHLEFGTYWTDALVNVLKILHLMATSDASLNQLVQKYPQYYGGTTSIKAKDQAFRKKMGRVYDKLSKIDTNIPITDKMTLDGLRLNFEDNSWLLVRPSGTEPKIRIVADANNKKRAKKLTELGKQIIINTLDQDSLDLS